MGGQPATTASAKPTDRPGRTYRIHRWVNQGMVFGRPESRNVLYFSWSKYGAGLLGFGVPHRENQPDQPGF